jgi:hypothetical protein
MAPVYDAPYNLVEMKMPLCILTRLLNMVAFCSKLGVKNCQRLEDQTRDYCLPVQH